MKQNTDQVPLAPLPSERFQEVQGTFEGYLDTLAKRRPKPEDYAEVEGFTPEEIAEDQAITESLRKRFADAQKNITPLEREQLANGKLVESIFTFSIEAGHLLGNGAEVTPTSHFDDYTRGIDCFVLAGPEDKDLERNDGGKRNVFGLAIDFSSKASDACEKLSHTLYQKNDHTGVETGILKGRVPSVKYGTDGQKKRRNMWVVKVIVGADGETVANFAEKVAGAAKEQPDKSPYAVATEVLLHHPIRDIIIDEILFQLVAFRNIAYAFHDKKRDGEKCHVGSLYHRAYVLFNKLLEEQGIDLKHLEKTRRGDKLASALHGMIGFVADPDKKYRLEEILGRLAQSMNG